MRALGNAGCTGQLEWCLTRPRFEFIKNLGAQTHQGSEGTLCKIFLNKDKITFKIQMLINFPKCAKLALMTTVSANLKSCPLVYPSVRLTGGTSSHRFKTFFINWKIISFISLQ